MEFPPPQYIDIHLWCHQGSPQKCASFVCQECASLLSYIYVSFIATYIWEYASFVCQRCASLLTRIYVSFIATYIREYASFVCQMCISFVVICLFQWHICTRVCKFPLSNMCISFLMYICLFHPNISFVCQICALRIAFVIRIYVSFIATYVREYASSVCQKCVHLIRHIYVSFEFTYVRE